MNLIHVCEQTIIYLHGTVLQEWPILEYFLCCCKGYKIYYSRCFLASQIKILWFFFPKTELAVLIRHKTHFTLRALSCQIIEDIFYPRMKAPMIQLPLSDRPLLFSGLQYRCEYYFMYRSWVHYLKSWQISKEKECGLMKIQKLEENVGSSLLSFGGRWLWLSNGSCTILMIMQR